MTRGVRLYLVGSFVLVSLAGCGRGFFQSEEREPWRAEAEIACLKSGAVKESARPCPHRSDYGSGRLRRGVSAQGRSPRRKAIPASVSRTMICGRRARSVTSPDGRLSRPPPPPASPYYSSQAPQPGYAPASNGPVSLSAPGVAPQDDEIELPADGTPAMNQPVARQPYPAASAYPPRASSAPYPERPYAAPVQPQPDSLPRLGPLAARQRIRPGRGQARGDTRLSDRFGARSLARRVRAAGGDALVRLARGRDQADLGLFVPRHERQFARPYLRTRLRQCA